MLKMHYQCVSVFVSAFVLASIFSITAQSQNRRLSSAEKCEVYKFAFQTVRTKVAFKNSLSKPFISENLSFIEGGCIDYKPVCPRNASDLAAANELTVATMNKGLASTFVPFKCSKTE